MDRRAGASAFFLVGDACLDGGSNIPIRGAVFVVALGVDGAVELLDVASLLSIGELKESWPITAMALKEAISALTRSELDNSSTWLLLPSGF